MKSEATKKENQHNKCTTLVFTWERGSQVQNSNYTDDWSRRKCWKLPHNDIDTKNYWQCNTTLMHNEVLYAGIKSNASYELRNPYIGWQHFGMHRQWSWRWAQVSPHGRRKPKRAKTKTLDKEWGVRVALEAFKSCIVRWWRFHVPTNLSSPQWVELYSLHCTVGIKLLLIIYTMIIMIIDYAKSKHNVSMINIKSNYFD